MIDGMKQISLRRTFLLLALAGVALAVVRGVLIAWNDTLRPYDHIWVLPTVVVVGIAVGALYGRPVFGGVISAVLVVSIVVSLVIFSLVIGPRTSSGSVPVSSMLGSLLVLIVALCFYKFWRAKQ